MCVCVRVCWSFVPFVRVTLNLQRNKTVQYFVSSTELVTRAGGSGWADGTFHRVLVADSLLTQVVDGLVARLPRIAWSGSALWDQEGPVGRFREFGRSSPDSRHWWRGSTVPWPSARLLRAQLRDGNDGRLQSSGETRRPRSSSDAESQPGWPDSCNPERADPAVTACSCRPVAAGIGD